MIFATDVQYTAKTAIAAGILFTDWQAETCDRAITQSISNIQPYEPGFFYKRELPCILSLLEGLRDEIRDEVTLIVIDGYQSVPVVGVAKNKFADTPKRCEVLRGRSRKPLFVTAAGIPLASAKLSVIKMHGDNRIPTLLKTVDQLCRGIVS